MHEAPLQVNQGNMALQAQYTGKALMSTSPPEPRAQDLEEEDAVDDFLDQLARIHDQPSISRLYDYLYKDVYRYFLRREEDSNDVQDLTSETFLRAVRGISKGKWSGEPPVRWWIFGIRQNVWREWLRKKAKERTLLKQSLQEVSVEESVVVIDRLIAREQTNKLWQLVKSLSHDYQQVLKFLYWEGLSYVEVSERMNRTVGSCKMLRKRALQQLKLKVEEAGLWDELVVNQDSKKRM